MIAPRTAVQLSRKRWKNLRGSGETDGTKQESSDFPAWLNTENLGATPKASWCDLLWKATKTA